MSYQHITYVVDDPVATITLNRPEALNAFTTRMLAEVRHALASAEADESVVGIVITGAGRGFCPGMDMNALDSLGQSKGGSGDSGEREDLSEFDTELGDHAMGEDFEVGFGYLMTIRKPVVSAINGACAGLGLAFALMTDLRFVERQAKFSTAFSQRGLVAEYGTSWMLPRLAGTGAALDLLWSARKFDGEEAHRLGIATHLVETGESAQAAQDYVRAIAANSSPTSLKVMKAQVYRHLNMTLGPSLEETNRWMGESLKREDFVEGVRSYIEKRPPAFKRIKGE